MIAIIDVCGNNLRSISNAIQALENKYVFTHDPKEIAAASHIILPGVGNAKTAMQALEDYALVEVIKEAKQPLLGICLGLQLLFEYSEENAVTCLGIIPGEIQRLPNIADHRVPHMGWNTLQWSQDSVLQHGLDKEAYVYFVHSYAYFSKGSCAVEIASSTHSRRFSAIVQQDNFYGMQFHPEKSAEVGMQLLKNFLLLRS